MRFTTSTPYPPPGGTPQALTQTDQITETNPHFSPDGKLLAFQHKEKQGSSVNLALMDWNTHQVRLLTHEKDPKRSWEIVAWSPDGKTLYANRGDLHEDTSAWSVDVATGAARELTPHTGNMLIGASSLSPDGKTLLIGSNEKGGYGNVALLDLATLQKKWITDTQWDAEPGSFSPVGRSVHLVAECGWAHVDPLHRREDLQGNTACNPGRAELRERQPYPLRAERRLVVCPPGLDPRAEFLRAGHPWRRRSRSRMSRVRGSARRCCRRRNSCTMRASTARSSPHFSRCRFNLKRDGSNPLIVLPHGGPTGQVVDSFSPRIIALVSRGYTVIAPNVRGSTGYGVAFEKANYQDLGGGDLQDEIYGVKFMEATGYIDPKKVGITGGSYGGFMTLMAIGKAPDIWAAAVEEYGIIDWYTMLQHSDPLLQEYEKSLLGDPVKDRAKYEAASPIQFLQQGARATACPAGGARYPRAA